MGSRFALVCGTLLLLFWGATGCNYRFTGQGEFPGGVRTLSIPIFANQTSEIGVESTFTNDLIFEMNRNGRTVLDLQENPDAVLNVTIRSVRIDAASRSAEQTSRERRVRFGVDVKLVAAQDNRVIWQRKGLSANETYPVSDDKLQTEKNKQDAIAELSRRMAERIYNSLVENF
jgi:outer membrane lipopolysaccharide assembly protein LptE/RlpB